MAETPEDPVPGILSAITCGEVILSPDQFATRESTRPTVPVCLDSELSVQEGCAALAAHRVSSAPVYDEKAGGFVGMLDYRDLVAYILAVLHKVPADRISADADLELTDIIRQATTGPQGTAGVPIKLVANLSKLNPLAHLYSTEPVLTAVKTFARDKVHRLVVLRQEGAAGGDTFVGIISQSTVAALIASRLGKLSTKPGQPRTSWPLGEKTLADLGLVKGDVISISPEDQVLEALYLMHEKKISSVGIVDRSEGDNLLLGSISMTDIKEILARRGGWKRLFDSAMHFFGDLRAEQGLQHHGDDRVPSFTVHPGTTLGSAVEKIAATRSHRVWVVEKDGKVVGVVSLSDVMAVIAARL
ncbi:cell separation during budding [Rhizophlyctis rosea]|uniref:Cell separation during budding n=1 Tax=Rhizophlyctis rosea TaxID=64517 RepID=A0AAD5WZH0_9FUNG|nr:cell separation during budding [Rhizophlyctis rosea]